MSNSKRLPKSYNFSIKFYRFFKHNFFLPKFLFFCSKPKRRFLKNTSIHRPHKTHSTHTMGKVKSSSTSSNSKQSYKLLKNDRKESIRNDSVNRNQPSRHIVSALDNLGFRNLINSNQNHDTHTTTSNHNNNNNHTHTSSNSRLASSNFRKLRNKSNNSTGIIITKYYKLIETKITDHRLPFLILIFLCIGVAITETILSKYAQNAFLSTEFNGAAKCNNDECRDFLNILRSGKDSKNLRLGLEIFGRNHLVKIGEKSQNPFFSSQ